MAEVQSRPRGSGRAGRGGRASRGGSRSAAKHLNGDASASEEPALEDQGELGQLKKQYMTQLVTLNELFPDWTDEDLVFALQETDGDIQTTIERITEGNVSRFSDVKKKSKEKTKPKAAESTTATRDATTSTTRGRGRGGFEGGRGGRGRGSERGRGSVRGARGGSVSSVPRASIPTTDAGGWDSTRANTVAAEGTWDQTSAAKEPPTSGQWGSVVASSATPATASEGQKSSLIPEGTKKSWASMLAQSKQASVAQKSVVEGPPITDTVPLESATLTEPTVPQVYEQIATPPTSTAHLTPENIITPSGSGADLTPPKDRLTEDNVESLPDESIPASTETTASTRDPRSAAGSVTPYGASHQAPISRPPMGGYATTAYKATGMPGRSASFQRRMMEQREAVVMPSNHSIDRTAVQFGSMGLNGEGKSLEADEGQEAAETRAQPPQQSPPSQPRASLPPVAPTNIPSEPIQEHLPTPKQAPGLPMPPQMQQPSPISNQAISQPPTGPQGMVQSGSQSSQPYGQYGGRYGPSSLATEPSAPVQKPYDAFSHQLNYGQSQAEQTMYPGHSQAPGALPQQAQSQLPGGYGQGAGDYSSQYTGDQQRGYQSLYSNAYGQQAGSAQQDQNAPPQRSGSGLGSGDASFGSSQASQIPSRFADAQHSGHNTPNPTIGGQQHMGSHSQQAQMMQQSQHGQSGAGYPYNQPYYSYGSYAAGAYMNQYPSQNYYNQQGYGAPFGGKGNLYGQPHHGYGMPSQGSFEHSSSPANTGGYGSSGLQSRDAFSGLGDYGRTGSAQQSQGQHSSTGGGFGGSMNDSYGRGASGFSNQSSQYTPSTSGAGDDSLKALHDAKTGPSPLLGQPGRPTSGMNTAGQGGNQAGFPPPQSSHQQGFGGGYPSHLNQQHSGHGSQYGGLGGLGTHQGSSQTHQSSQYGGYGSGFGNTYGGNYGGRGGWGGGGGNYGH